MYMVLLEEMTWPEIRAALQNGMRAVIVCAAPVERHRFDTIVLISSHGGNFEALEEVAVMADLLETAVR